MSHKITIIDLEKTIRDIEKPTEVIEFFETPNEGLVFPDDFNPNDGPMVEVTRKLYKCLELSELTLLRVNTRELYYVNVEDFEKVMPLLKGIIEVETEDLKSEVRDIRGDYFGYVNMMNRQWYVKVGRFIERLFGRS